MDYRWVSTAHTRTGWHRICKYILRFVRAHLGARYVWRLLSRGKKSQFRFFFLFSVIVNLPYAIWCSPQKSLQKCFCTERKTATKAPTKHPGNANAVRYSFLLLSHISWLPSPPSVLQLLRCHVITGSWVQFPRWVLLKISLSHFTKACRALKCETPGAQIISGWSHMCGFKCKDGNNNVGLEPASGRSC